MKSLRKINTLTTEIAKDGLTGLIDSLQEDLRPIIIKNKNGNRAVLLSMKDFDLFRETLDRLDAMDDASMDEWTEDADGILPSSRPETASDDYRDIFQFKISLEHLKPDIWRRIQVPANYTFWDLHVAIQDVMGWEDVHMHMFECVDPKKGHTVKLGTPFEELEACSLANPEWDVLLADFFTQATSTVRYIYDPGDNWAHQVELEEIIARDGLTEYPICVDGRRACPPEDCGGIAGYQQLLEAMRNPRKAGDEYWIEWIGEGFDPEYFSPEYIIFEDPEERWEDIYGTE